MELELLKEIERKYKFNNTPAKQQLEMMLQSAGISQYPVTNMLEKLDEYISNNPNLAKSINKNDDNYYDYLKARLQLLFLAVSLNEGMAPIEQEKGLEIIDETFDSQSFNVREVMEKFAESGFYNQILVNKIIKDASILSFGGSQINPAMLDLEGSKKIIVAAFEATSTINQVMLDRTTEYLKRKQIELNIPKPISTTRFYSKKDLDFIFEQWKVYHKLAFEKKARVSDITIENGKVILHEGDLFHGIGRFGKGTVSSIAKYGLLASDFVGDQNFFDGANSVDEWETFACIDFYRAYKDMPVDEALQSVTDGHSRLPKSKEGESSDRIAFVIQAKDLEKYAALTDYDPYKDTEKGLAALKIAGGKLHGEKNKYSSIIVGLPSNIISMIIVDTNMEKNKEKIEFLQNMFKTANIVTTQGILIAKSKELQSLSEKQTALFERLAFAKNLRAKLLEAKSLREKTKHSQQRKDTKD